MTKKHINWSLWLTMGIAAVNMALMLTIDGWKYTKDTMSYVQAIGPILSQGFDTFRTIGYPLAINLCRWIAGSEYCMQLLVGVQVVMFFVSVGVMWWLIKSITRSNVLAAVFTIFYAIVPGISTYATIINPESLSISAIVFFIASFYRIYNGNESNWTVIIFFISIVAIFALRPASLAFSGALVVAVTALFVRHSRRRYAIAGLSVLALCVPLFQYVGASRAIGIPTLSSVSIINRYMILRKNGEEFNPERVADPELRELIIRYDDSIPGDFYSHGYDFITVYHKQHQLDSLLKAEHTPWNGLPYRIKKAMTKFYISHNYGYMFTASPYTNFLVSSPPVKPLRYPLYPIVLILGLIVAIVKWRRAGRVPWFTLFLLTLLAAAVASSLLYGPDSFDRLTVPAAPAFILLIAMAFPTFAPHILKTTDQKQQI